MGLKTKTVNKTK